MDELVLEKIDLNGAYCVYVSGQVTGAEDADRIINFALENDAFNVRPGAAHRILYVWLACLGDHSAHYMAESDVHQAIQGHLDQPLWQP